MLQVYTQADQFGSTVAKLRDLGFTINSEESELVYRPTAGEGQQYESQHNSQGVVMLLQVAACTLSVGLRGV